MSENPQLSVIIPVFNEEKNILPFYKTLVSVLETAGVDFEILFINDGSNDDSASALKSLAVDSRIIVLELSRNFGKELAVTAGLQHCHGQAAVIIDADFQHPIELIPRFIEKWQQGAEVVVGIRNKNKGAGMIKNAGSFLFYKIIKLIADIKITPNASDFRLLDRAVIDAFNTFSERGRLTRGLIDWLGFRRDYIYFDSPVRAEGKASYGFIKLMRLAFNSFVSLSLIPLKLAGYLGIIITFIAGLAGLYILFGKYIFHWALASSFSGPAQLAIFITFLVGIILSSLGLMALYIANIHTEILKRPLYVIRKTRSKS